jgi:hypothetical protein
MRALIKCATITIVLIVVLGFFSGCSGSPSENAGKSVVQNMIKSQNQSDFIKLVSFRKTNGIREGNSYRMEYEVEIEFREDCMFDPYGSIYNASRIVNGGIYSAIVVRKKKGERIKKSDVMSFEKTERGWRGNDGSVY